MNMRVFKRYRTSSKAITKILSSKIKLREMKFTVNYSMNIYFTMFASSFLLVH